METEGFFIGLDAVCMVVAIAIYSVLDPAVLMTGEERFLDGQRQELQGVSRLEEDKRAHYQYDSNVQRGGE